MKKNNKGKKEVNNFCKYLVIILVVIIIIILAYKRDVPNYWVDNVYLDTYTYNGETKVTLYYHLISDINHKNNEMKKGAPYFKCHNKKDDSFYYIIALESKKKINSDVSEEILGINDLDNYDKKQYNNSYEVINNEIIDNIKDIDYCTYLGIDTKF